MTPDLEVVAFSAKARENLASAQSELASDRFNACANRCYYACFQAAIVALIRASIGSGTSDRSWKHAYVQAQFTGQLINRRKVFSASLSAVLPRLMELRLRADYQTQMISQTQVRRAIRDAETFITTVMP